MPTVAENLNRWGGDYPWTLGGHEWSKPWGGAEAQWFGAILPRIHGFLPAETILEIAPGFGRWTHYLKGHCRRMILVDLAPKCIEHCKELFSSSSHITYHVNDGKSLAMVPDNSVDFVFSFDSLVHAESDVLQAYLAQLERKLTPDGVGFIHHSNIGEYRIRWALKTRLVPGLVRRYLYRKGLMDYYHWRSFSMTAGRFEEHCKHAGLQCISQELVNWKAGLLVDCFSLFTKKSSVWARPNVVFRNFNFMKEVEYIARLSSLYSVSNLQDGKLGPPLREPSQPPHRLPHRPPALRV